MMCDFAFKCIVCSIYLEVLVIAEHLDNILFCHNSTILKNSF